MVEIILDEGFAGQIAIKAANIERMGYVKNVSWLYAKKDGVKRIETISTSMLESTGKELKHFGSPRPVLIS